MPREIDALNATCRHRNVVSPKITHKILKQFSSNRREILFQILEKIVAHF